MRIDVYHSIRWSTYKAQVFSAMHRIAEDEGDDVRFLQIADTEAARTELGGVDLEAHRYPHELLFPGTYEAIPRMTLARTLFERVYRSDAEVVAIAGYDRPEHWAMLCAAILSRKRRAVFCDSTLADRRQTRWKGLLKRLFFGRCDTFLAYGSRSEQLLVHYGADPHAVYQPCNAAALPDTYSPEAALAARAAGARTEGTAHVLYVGRLAPEKSLPTLFHAFAAVSGARPGSRLTIVGSGPGRVDLEILAAQLGIAHATCFTGPLDGERLAAEYATASCLVLPSVSEPWGLVANEALHHGCPVIASDRCGCVPELVHDGSTGFVFETGDVTDLAAKMLAVVDRFAPVLEVARRCQATVAPYTPAAAARNILDGCRHAAGGATAGRGARGQRPRTRSMLPA